MYTKSITTVAALLLAAQSAWSSSSTTSIEKVRQQRPFALTTSINEPAPSLFGLNASLAFGDSYRATMGYGSIEVTNSLVYDSNANTFVAETASATTLGVGVEKMFMSGNFTPVVGIKTAYVSVDGDIEVGGFDKSGGHVYFNAGIDWQASNGLVLALGYNYSLAGTEKSGSYLSAGWAFDWFKI